MKNLYWMFLTTAGAEIIIDIMSYIFTGKHNFFAISIAIIYLIATILVYLWDEI